MTIRDRLRDCLLTLAVLVAGVGIAALALAAASATEWPTRIITVVVPLGAGSASDVMARVVMDQVSRQVGQPIVIENRPGAGGTIGANMVAKSPADGYTVLIYGALASAHALYSKLPYDTLADFVPVIALGQQPLVVLTSPSKGYKTLADLIVAAKARPGELNYASAGIGSASHFGAERLRVSAGFEAQNVAFRGAADSLTEVVAGRMDFSVQPFTTAVTLIRDGKLVALAVSAPKRLAAIPDVPTTVEAGLPPESVYPFYSGMYLPAKTPREIVEKLRHETEQALAVPAVQQRLAGAGVESMPMGLEQFGEFVRNDVAANVALVKAAHIPLQ
jgi:tripartite-type tricarboxylate transporter receptor subunit TctC